MLAAKKNHLLVTSNLAPTAYFKGPGYMGGEGSYELGLEEVRSITT